MRCCIAIVIAMCLPLPFSGGTLPDAQPKCGDLLVVNPAWQALVQGDTSWQSYCRYVAHLSGVPFHRVAAMWAYETAWGSSRLWRKHRNPAGIRHNRHAARLGAHSVWSSDEGGTVKASYPNLIASAENYAWTLSLKRYQPCHDIDDEYEFWQCMRTQGWFSGTNVKARSVLSQKIKNKMVLY